MFSSGQIKISPLVKHYFKVPFYEVKNYLGFHIQASLFLFTALPSKPYQRQNIDNTKYARILQHMILGAILGIRLFLQQSPSWIFFQDLYFRIGHDSSSDIHTKYLGYLNSFSK